MRRLALPGRVLRHLVLLAGSAVMLAPFALMLATSFKPKEEIFAPEFHFLPQRWAGLENYREAFAQVPLGHFLLNGVLVTAAIFALQVVVNVPAAYALAKLRFRGRATLFGAVLVCLLIPYQAIALPIYILFYALGLLNSYAALVLPFTISVFGIFLMRQFFLGIPDDLIDAARIDGAGEFGIYRKIVLPNLGAALATLGIFTFMATWNDYLWPLIVITTHEKRTLPLLLTWYNSQHGQRYDLTMAASVIVLIPVLLVYVFFQRWIVRGVALSGMK